MTTNTTLRLDRLELANFRCFASCEIDLHEELTVLAAENGQGKSAILDAISISLATFVDTLSQTKQYGGFETTDVRLLADDSGVMLPAEEARISVGGYIIGQHISWSLLQRGASARSIARTKATAQLRDKAQQLQKQIMPSGQPGDDDVMLLPLVAHYGANRIWSTQSTKLNSRERQMIGKGRMAGYTKCFSASASFAEASNWFGERYNEARDPKYRFLPEYSRPERLISSVTAAIRTVLEPTGWTELSWDDTGRTLRAKHRDVGRLPVALLSDGIRNMIALVVDIARRCAILNPHLGEGAAKKTPGILLIDEVDLHLHPSWQQQIVGLLRKAFPAMQVVLTTHSPHVLSTIHVESIRTITVHEHRGIVATPTNQTRGIRSNDVLARVMNVDPIPPVEEAEWLSEYRALLEQGLAAEEAAQKLRRNLEAHFGSDHYVMKELDSIERVVKFKESLRSRKQ